MGRPGMMEHPKFRRLVAMLKMPAAHVRGHLECLWDVAYQCGRAEIGDEMDVELAAGWAGEPGALCKAMLGCGGNGSAGFIERVTLVTLVTDCNGQASQGATEQQTCPSDGSSPRPLAVTDRPVRYRIHDLFDHAPDYVAGRAHREDERRKEKKCERCAAVYHSSDQRSKFCSPACRTAAWREKHEQDVTAGDGVKRNGDGVRQSVTPRNGSPAPAPAPAPVTGSASKTGEGSGPGGSKPFELTGQDGRGQRRARAAKAPNPDIKRLLDAAVEACDRHRGFKPLVRGAPEAAAMASLLSGRDYAHALEIVEEFYREPPDWNREQGALALTNIPAAATKILARMAGATGRTAPGGEGRDFGARPPDFVIGEDDDGADQVQPDAHR